MKIFTGASPFIDSTPFVARSVIKQGERPPQPGHLALEEDVWALVRRCWNQEAHLRPQALRVSCRLHSILEPRISASDLPLPRRGIPSWTRLITRPLTLGEKKCISLITHFFSDLDESGAVGALRGDDIQLFVDIIDEVLPRRCLRKIDSLNEHVPFHIRAVVG